MQSRKPPYQEQREITQSKDSLSREMKNGIDQIRNIMDFGNSDVKTSSLLALQEPLENKLKISKPVPEREFLEDAPSYSPYNIGMYVIILVFGKLITEDPYAQKMGMIQGQRQREIVMKKELPKSKEFWGVFNDRFGNWEFK
jgi:hypothetical protein